MLFIMTSRAHSCGYLAIMVYYCYVVHQSEICNVCLVWNTAHWLEVRPHPLKEYGGVISCVGASHEETYTASLPQAPLIPSLPAFHSVQCTLLAVQLFTFHMPAGKKLVLQSTSTCLINVGELPL